MTKRQASKAAVFIDRDGTLIEEVGYLRRKEDLRLSAGTLQAIQILNEQGLPAVVVTNQSAVSRGLLSEIDLGVIHQHLTKILEAEGVHLSGIYYCPHHPKAGSEFYRRRCECRKPEPGLLLRAASELGVDLQRSYMIGDSERDIEAGHRAGCQAILVKSGYGQRSLAALEKEHRRRPDHVSADILGAVNWILEQSCEGKTV